MQENSDCKTHIVIPYAIKCFVVLSEKNGDLLAHEPKLPPAWHVGYPRGFLNHTRCPVFSSSAIPMPLYLASLFNFTP